MKRRHLKLTLALLALATQPLGALAAGTSPGGGGSCEVVTCSGGGGGSTTPPVQYYLSPGYGASYPYSNSNDGTTDYFNGYGIQGLLQNSSSSAQPVTATAPAANYRSFGIVDQARAFAGAIQSGGTSASKIIVLGHSTGVARIREAVEHQSAYGNMNKIVGLVSIGGANDGAAIADNAPSLAGFLTTVYGAMFIFASPASAVAVVPLTTYARNLVGDMLNTATIPDLRPNSTFFQRLNNPSFGTVPTSIRTLQIEGGNNNLDALIAGNFSTQTTAGVQGIRTAAANVMTIVAGVAWVGAFWTFGATIPMALAFTAGSYTTANLPGIWNTYGVGSSQGDAFLTKATQQLPSAMGGTALTPVVLSKAVHVSAYGELNVQDNRDYNQSATMKAGLRTLQQAVNIPFSAQ